LRARLPQGTAFLDFVLYKDIEEDPNRPGEQGRRRIARYAGFVLRPGQPIEWVELGPSAPILQALGDWRQALASQKGSAAAQGLRRLVWDKVAAHLPAGTHTVYLSVGGPLARLPWAALPGRKPGTVLLEDHALAVVPHGPFLLDRLTAPPSAASGPGRLLA